MRKIKSLGTEGRGKERCTKGEKEKGKNQKGRVVIHVCMLHVSCLLEKQIFVRKTNPQYTAKNLTAKLK